MDYYGVIGNPVAHSKSPFIHERFAQLTQQELIYERIECPIGQFKEKIEYLQSTHQSAPFNSLNQNASVFKGCNVTIPFKQEAFDLATKRSPRALLAQACNTLKFEEGHIIADNTDGLGLIRDIEINAKFPIKGKKVLLLGAGGAAAGALGPLIEAMPLQITIANRTVSKAEHLCLTHTPLAQLHQVQLLASSFNAVGEAYDLLINATASSLAGVEVPVNGSVLSPQALGYDMMYGPNAQAFLEWVELHGGVARDGLGMLVEQAAEAFYIWRGVRPDSARVLQEMRQRV